MQLIRLRLKNFRNYEEADLTFGSGLNAITGDNAQGKSNLLEAIYLLITGRSFRTPRLKELIRWGADTLTIQATFVKHDIEQTLTIGYNGQEKKILHNSTPLSSFSSLLGILQGTLLSPEDRQLISGPPALRRRFLDLHLSQIDPSYLQNLSRYYHALKQRNTLLRNEQPDTLSIWEEQMAAPATYLQRQREKALDSLKTDFSLSYRPSQPAWSENREKELIVAHTLTGPHRDDFTIALDGHKMKAFGSEGQKTLAAISLRFTQWEIMNTPLMLIDDVSGNLDPTHQKNLMKKLSTLGQVFLTAPHPIDAETQFTVTSGQVSKTPAHPSALPASSGLH